MDRRDFLLAGAAAGLAPCLLNSSLLQSKLLAAPPHVRAGESTTAKDGGKAPAVACGPGYASPAEAMKAPREKLLYTIGLYVGSDDKKPDFLATVDADPDSPTYSKVIHRLPMPFVGDELHHFGWNACSSCHGDAEAAARRFLIVPGQRSSRIYVVDTADPRAPKIHKVISPESIKQKTKLSAPHTVHCTPDGQIMISMLGDADGNAPGGFLLLDDKFEIAGRWERNARGMKFNYDFWYQ
ncbi:MAG TPA: selenium-binding protein SBP56-related protein, partial [Pirellulales bacterium]